MRAENRELAADWPERAVSRVTRALHVPIVCHVGRHVRCRVSLLWWASTYEPVSRHTASGQTGRKEIVRRNSSISYIIINITRVTVAGQHITCTRRSVRNISARLWSLPLLALYVYIDYYIYTPSAKFTVVFWPIASCFPACWGVERRGVYSLRDSAVWYDQHEAVSQWWQRQWWLLWWRQTSRVSDVTDSATMFRFIYSPQ